MVESDSDRLEQRIAIHSMTMDLTSVMRVLETAVPADTVRFSIKSYRAVENAVLIALVAATGTGVGALVSGLLQMLSQRVAKRVVIQGRSGRRVEVSENVSTEKLAEFLRLARDLDIDRIDIDG